VTVTETTRLRLRRLTLDDSPFLIELLNDRDFLANIGDRAVHSIADAHRYLTHGPFASYEQHGFGLYLMELKEPPTAIGMCGLLHRASHPDVELGFALLPGFRGRGYIQEAARATLQLAIETLGLRVIVAITAPGNAISAHILRRLGFVYERPVRFTDDGGESCLFVLTRTAADSAQ
jgi:ribosomal-protein-alanine N-acetyltransferase